MIGQVLSQGPAEPPQFRQTDRGALQFLKMPQIITSLWLLLASSLPLSLSLSRPIVLSFSRSVSLSVCLSVCLSLSAIVTDVHFILGALLGLHVILAQVVPVVITMIICLLLLCSFVVVVVVFVFRLSASRQLPRFPICSLHRFHSVRPAAVSLKGLVQFFKPPGLKKSLQRTSPGDLEVHCKG